MAKHTRCDIVLRNNLNLVSLQHTADLDNGVVVVIGDLLTGEREVRGVKLEAVTGAIDKTKIAIIDSPEKIYRNYTTEDQQLKNFYNKAGKPMRGYILADIQMVELSEEAFTGTPAVGKYVKMTATGKLEVADAETDAIGKIVEKRQEGIATFWGGNGASGAFEGNVYPMFAVEIL